VNWRDDSDAKLEKRVNDLLVRAREDGARGDYVGEASWYGDAMDVCRVLVERHPSDPRHIAVLAGGLYNLAYILILADRPAEAREALAESERHYDALAAQDRDRYAVVLCDVRLRVALTLVTEGRFAEAVPAGRAALAAYEAAGAGDRLEREFGVVRAHALIGRALLLARRSEEALAEFDAALFSAERLREEAGIAGTDFSWLALAPESFRQAAPEWLSAAVAAMELHDAAGRWGIAGDAANIAMRVSGGLAAIGDDTARVRFEMILARAKRIWWAAEHPVQAEGQRTSPFREYVIGRGPRLTPDVTAISRPAGWGDPPVS
jgi:tetratricopeptide (TPR) repeat protein